MKKSRPNFLGLFLATVKVALITVRIINCKFYSEIFLLNPYILCKLLLLTWTHSTNVSKFHSKKKITFHLAYVLPFDWVLESKSKLLYLKAINQPTVL